MTAENDLFVSEQEVSVPGVYYYVDNPDGTTISCWPSPEERTIVLKAKDKIPKIKSRDNQLARYKLIARL